MIAISVTSYCWDDHLGQYFSEIQARKHFISHTYIGIWKHLAPLKNKNSPGNIQVFKTDFPQPFYASRFVTTHHACMYIWDLGYKGRCFIGKTTACQTVLRIARRKTSFKWREFNLTVIRLHAHIHCGFASTVV